LQIEPPDMKKKAGNSNKERGGEGRFSLFHNRKDKVRAVGNGKIKVPPACLEEKTPFYPASKSL